MSKCKPNTEDWINFRDDNIFGLIILYKQIKDFSNFDKLTDFSFISKRNAICSFYIKCGFIMNNGKKFTLKNFLEDGDYKSLYELYKNKIKNARDLYAHNGIGNGHINFSNINITNDDIDNFYNNVIILSKKIDNHYGCIECDYDTIYGIQNFLISSLNSKINNSIELENIKSYFIKNGIISINLQYDIQSGEIFIYDQSNNKKFFN